MTFDDVLVVTIFTAVCFGLIDRILQVNRW